MVEAAPYKLLIVDDHALVRSGMRVVLEDRANISAIDEASNGERAVDMAARQHYDLVLMDMNLPGMNGLEASERIIGYLPDVRIIMVTGQVDAALSRSFAKAGIAGYISKDSNADEIKNAVQRVINGNAHMSPDVAQRVAIDMMHGEL
nr:response regulator transcription factor [Gammaproteobacteria bacterium]